MITLWFGLFAEPKTYIAFLQVAVEAYKDLFFLTERKLMERAIQDSLFQVTL